jgi:hypothetical protein
MHTENKGQAYPSAWKPCRSSSSGGRNSGTAAGGSSARAGQGPLVAGHVCAPRTRVELHDCGGRRDSGDAPTLPKPLPLLLPFRFPWAVHRARHLIV